MNGWLEEWTKLRTHENHSRKVFSHSSNARTLRLITILVTAYHKHFSYEILSIFKLRVFWHFNKLQIYNVKFLVHIWGSWMLFSNCFDIGSYDFVPPTIILILVLMLTRNSLYICEEIRTLLSDCRRNVIE